MVQETSRNLKQAENFTKACFLKLANADINISYLLNGRKLTQNCDQKIMYKVKDKRLARYRYKQKQTPRNLDLGYTCMLYSVTKPCQ